MITRNTQGKVMQVLRYERCGKYFITQLALLVFIICSTLSVQAEHFWHGHWQLVNKADNQLIMTLTVTQDEHGLVGHYQLLPAFCQTEMPTADSYCPFTGANGQLSTLTVDDHSLRATGKDPFAPQQDFSINLTSFDLTEVSVAAISADSGKLSVLADASK